MNAAFRISIAANLVLLSVVAALLWRDRPATIAVVPTPTSSIAAPPSTPSPPAAAPAGVPRSAEDAKVGPAAMAQLEQLGISRSVLASALREDSNRRWARREVELQKKHAPRPVPEREYIEFTRARDAEQVRELREALGEQGYLAWDKEQTLRTLNAGGLPLTEAEAEQAYRLQKEFDQQYRALEMAREDGIGDGADVAALQAQAQASLDRSLEQLLGKSRYNALRGLADPMADVQWRYGDLNPTPAQANAVIRAEEDYRDREAALARRLRENPVLAGNAAAELQALNAARDEDLRRIFGAEAYEAVKRQNDSTYQTLRQYAAAWDLQEPEIQSVYQALHAFRDEAERARSAAALREAAGQAVNWREINAALEQVRQQTEAGLLSLIGGERLHRLKQNGLLGAN